MKFISISILALAFGAMTLFSCSKEDIIQEIQPEKSLENAPNNKKMLLLFGFIEIEFGNRQGVIIDGEWVESSCLNSGLCKITIDLGAPPANGGSGAIGLVDGVLMMEIDKTSMSSETIATNFSGSTIKVGAEIILSSETCSDAGLPDGYTISTGDYPFVDDNDVIRVFL